MNCTDIIELSPQYLSGELDERRVAEFAVHLKACPGCAQQVELDTRLRDAILAEDIDTAALDRRVRRSIRAGSIHVHWWVAAATVAAIVVIALLWTPQTARVCADAERDHRMEVIDHQRRTWLSDRSSIETLVEGQGLSSPVGSLAPAGYQLDRGKLCRLGGRVFVHLVYTDGTREFSVFLRKLDGEPVLGPARVTREHVAFFQTRNLTAMVVGDPSDEGVLRFARHAATVL
jgi:anti-sigma factor RsiW